MQKKKIALSLAMLLLLLVRNAAYFGMLEQLRSSELVMLVVAWAMHAQRLCTLWLTEIALHILTCACSCYILETLICVGVLGPSDKYVVTAASTTRYSRLHFMMIPLVAQYKLIYSTKCSSLMKQQ